MSASLDRPVNLRVGTIIARNYLPFARILARSVARHHPDVRLAALVFDDRDGSVDGTDEPFDVLTIEDLGPEAPELLRMAALYDVTELATALKPWLLDHLLESGADAALYLDPDIEVFSPLIGLGDLAADHGIVLTPHAVLPMPRDGRYTDETTILAAGIYNLGFIGVGTGAREAGGGRPPFLDFWKERLRRECVIAPLGMRFVDQRWIDFVPGIYEPAIVRDPTCNVAYWNLDSRIVTCDDPPPASGRAPGEGAYRIDGAPLTFFHFSGYKPTSPHLLSTHQSDPPRILLSERPDLRRIVGEYGALLLAAGYGQEEPPSYGFGTMANGVPVDDAVRKILRDLTAAADAGQGPVPPLPWTPDGAAALCALLRRPPPATGDPGRLSVYLATVFAQRVDELRPRFFDPQVADRDRFLDWARSEARAGRLAAALVPAAEDGGGTGAGAGGADLPLADSQWTPGDQLVGGAAVAADPLGPLSAIATLRALAAGIGESGQGLSTFVAPTPAGDRPDLLPPGDGRRDHRVAIVSAGAAGAGPSAHLAGAVGPGFFAGRRVVVVADWPLSSAPEGWLAPFTTAGPVAEVWATSEGVRQALAPVCDVPVRTLPFRYRSGGSGGSGGCGGSGGSGGSGSLADRVDPALPARWTVAGHVDLRLPLELSNPLGLIAAYTAAFSTADRARLVLTVANANGATATLERIRLTAVDRADVRVVTDDRLDDTWLDGVDCLASLHRGDGVGWATGMALARGVTVVATAVGAVVEQAGDGADLVPWSEAEVPAGTPVLAAGHRWAEPDGEAASVALRRWFEDPVGARELAGRGRTSFLAAADPDRHVEFLRDRIEALGGVPASGVGPTGSAEASDRPRPLGPPRPPEPAKPLPRRIERAATRLLGRGR